MGLGPCALVALKHPSFSCQVWDVTMQDLCSGAIGLDTFRGVAFVGGFSYADVLGSAKGGCANLCPSLPQPSSEEIRALFFPGGKLARGGGGRGALSLGPSDSMSAGKLQ